MYNIQSYIVECIESCLNQEGVGINDYEIIIVNDGSTDRSLSLAENAIRYSKNARIVTQINAGVSVVRNNGIKQAKGEYIWFVDGDDLVESYAIATLIKEITKTSCDVYIFNFRSFNQAGIINSSDFENYEYPLPGKTINEDYDRVLPNLVWAAVYRREFLLKHHLYFIPKIRHEDDEFTMRVNYLAESLLILNESLYKYRINDSSFMSRMKKDNTESFLSLLKIRESHNLFWGNNSSFYNKRRGHLSFLIITMRYDLAFNMNNINKYEQVKWVLYKDVFKYCSWKRKLFLCIVIFLPENIIKWMLIRFRWERKK